MKDVLLWSTLPMLLQPWASGGPLQFDWWPTQTNREGDGSPHVIERGGCRGRCQIILRRKSLADEALHRDAVEKHLFESENTSV